MTAGIIIHNESSKQKFTMFNQYIVYFRINSATIIIGKRASKRSYSIFQIILLI